MMGRAPPTIVELPQTFERQLVTARAAQASARNKINEDKLVIEQHNESIVIPYSIGDIVLLHNPVMPPGPGQKRLFRPYDKVCKVVGVQLPNVLSLVLHPQGGPVFKVSMRRVKMAPPNLQPVRATPASKVNAATANLPPEPVVSAAPALARKSNLSKKPAATQVPASRVTTKSGRSVRAKVHFE
jgi:hypothetical protein